MLYTGVALVDAIKLGRFGTKQTEGGERLVYRRQKTRKKNGQLVSIPVHPDLREVIDRLPDSGTFLQTRFGKQRSPDGLGNDMSKWCNRAGVPACSAHGLRKACARRLAEAGASAPEIQAITGHKTLSEVQRYIAEANREVMADSGMAKLIARPNGEQTLANLIDTFAKNYGNQLKINDKYMTLAIPEGLEPSTC
ncbi:tyrosine-type recombinase/integrase [Ruegeria sp. THAF57]|uniref:tyrosine-type recombinase/integrase n=1 Tax=Ruegeria sp. THAF57 TaxID=2744555 RepID=UPI00351A10B0